MQRVSFTAVADPYASPGELVATMTPAEPTANGDHVSDPGLTFELRADTGTLKAVSQATSVVGIVPPRLADHEICSLPALLGHTGAYHEAALKASGGVVLVPVATPDVVSHARKALGSSHGVTHFIVVAPEAWAKGGARWAQQLLLFTARALQLHANAQAAPDPRHSLLTLIDGRASSIVVENPLAADADHAAADPHAPFAAVPLHAVTAALARPLSNDSNLVISTTASLAERLPAPSVDNRIGEIRPHGWRRHPSRFAVRATAIHVDRLFALGASFLHPAMLEYGVNDVDRHEGDPWCEEGHRGGEYVDLAYRLPCRRVATVPGLLACDVSAATTATAVRTLTGPTLAAEAERVKALEHALLPEVPPEFDPEHYPKGVNLPFYTMSAPQLSARFGGSNGIFHDTETRDIARCRHRIADIVVAEARDVLDTVNAGSPKTKEAAEALPVLTLLELGCGTGLITEAFVKSLHERAPARRWHVFATEVSPGFVDLATQRLRDFGADAVAKEAADADLFARGSIDIVHHPPHSLAALPSSVAALCPIIDVYHHLEYPQTLLREIRRVLVPGGRVLLVDFIRDASVHKSHPEDPSWVLKHVRGDQATFEKEVEAAGFIKVRDVAIDGLAENYAVLFQSTKPLPAQ